MKEEVRRMPLPTLPKIPSVLGSKSEKDKIIKDTEEPEEDRDVVNKKYADDHYVAI